MRYNTGWRLRRPRDRGPASFVSTDRAKWASSARGNTVQLRGWPVWLGYGSFWLGEAGL